VNNFFLSFLFNFLQQLEEAAKEKQSQVMDKPKNSANKFSELYISCWLIKAKIMSLKF
jgi:hypothetical protein